jgi:cold shock protein
MAITLRCVARDSSGKDVFVHISALERSGLTALNEGERVTVDIVEGQKGWKRRKYD